MKNDLPRRFMASLLLKEAASSLHDDISELMMQQLRENKSAGTGEVCERCGEEAGSCSCDVSMDKAASAEENPTDELIAAIEEMRRG